MTTKTIANGILRAVAIIVGIALLLYFLYAVRSVIAYLAMAGVIALLGRPMVIFFRKKLKMPNTLATVLAMLAMVGVLIGLISMFIPLVSEQSRNLSLLNIDQLQKSFNQLYSEILTYFDASPSAVNQVLEPNTIKKDILEGLNLGFIPDLLNSLVGTVGDVSIGLFSVLFISFFFLKDSKLLQNAILTFVPSTKEGGMKRSIDSINNLLSRYFVGILFQLLILFTIYTIALLIIGIENAVVIAFLCALFNIIPYVGPIIGAAVMVFLTMTSNLGQDFSTVILPKTGYVLIGVMIGQLVDNFFSQPFIFSNSVKSHPLEIFLVIIIAGLLFGITGMVVAVPGYTAIKVILKEFLSDNKIVKSLTKDL
ncbi:AI-2E family transporter [Sediminicola luteus]|uniref:AI-2E family transporter n=1 Tax=Sediminicola luteus TaxID=319238 RepID=A0A2A4G3L7_9FLAO|nr:AI-2E family transporter [Sediminicola luteus]PCE62574.1 AI-2E family transporter [Sediminicola luteus]